MFLRATKWFIVISTLASVAGWTLSALGALNRTGYAVFAAVVIAIAILFKVQSSKFKVGLPSFPSLPSVNDFGKLRRRLRRFLPASFSVLAALVFISGVLYAPNDHTALSYRLARVLQWLAHGHWFWIHTPNYRMNDRACGIEWLSAPLLLFLRSDRALFLLNFIPFILLPGLIFSVWTRLGVRPRVAWSWMWLLPTGYCFLLQAGGAANDAFPTVYALAAIDFALRARGNSSKFKVQSSKSVSEGRVPRVPDSGSPALNLEPGTLNLELSLLSAALMVGAKASNMPLGLPWAVIFFPALWDAWKRRGQLTTDHRQLTILRALAWPVVLIVAVVVSFVPTAILNIRYLHDWSGLSIEHAGMNMKSPIAGLLGNAVLLVTNNFVPTFFPMAGWWNHHALEHFPAALVRMMDANFEAGYNILGEMPTEDWAGLGFGLSVLLVISILAGLWHRGSARNTEHGTRHPQSSTLYFRLALLAPWAALLAYCLKTGMVTPARLIAPYYPLLFPALLIAAGQAQVVRRRWWKVCAGVTLLLALAALVVTPPRPLWPWRAVLSRMVAARPNQPQLLRAQRVYEVYAHRSDPLAQIRQWFPPDLKVIGFIGTGDDLDISLWKPYGSRRVEPFFVEDSGAKIRELGVEYVVVGDFILRDQRTTIDEWLHRTNAELLQTTTATMTVTQAEQKWYLAKMTNY